MRITELSYDGEAAISPEPRAPRAARRRVALDGRRERYIMEKCEAAERAAKIWTDALRNVPNEIKREFEDELILAIQIFLHSKPWDGTEYMVSLGTGFGCENPVACALKKCGLGYQNSSLLLSVFISLSEIRVIDNTRFLKR